ncbi:hypothetical protein BLL52_3164 [Rhodoferax antarcticus ANT.BR]|uniref:Uncharacterized protein n=1 Tax=Rhodoferax antarcticus ANT.BR TaxID=1111071 RepID=A0A1Q8YBV8_9BURK|nr:hypothetical protein BLL52_3164 [Rhodoferax antarcticus ANT.BR]
MIDWTLIESGCIFMECLEGFERPVAMWSQKAASRMVQGLGLVVKL